jgi:hypothetical protein
VLRAGGGWLVLASAGAGGRGRHRKRKEKGDNDFKNGPTQEFLCIFAIFFALFAVRIFMSSMYLVLHLCSFLV